MTDEPRRHRGFMLVLLAVAAATVPFPFVGRPPTTLLGFPLWLWLSAAATLGLSIVTAWGIRTYWKDEEPD